MNGVRRQENKRQKTRGEPIEKKRCAHPTQMRGRDGDGQWSATVRGLFENRTPSAGRGAYNVRAKTIALHHCRVGVRFTPHFVLLLEFCFFVQSELTDEQDGQDSRWKWLLCAKVYKRQSGFGQRENTHY